MTESSRALRILFLMHYPGYLRYYDSTVKLLAERGHTVILGWTQPEKQSEGSEALVGAGEQVVDIGQIARRQDEWRDPAEGLRHTIDYARYLHPRYANSPYLRNRREYHLPPVARGLTRIRTLPPPLYDLLIRALLTVEAAIPSARRLEQFLHALRPDVVLVTPLVGEARQTDFVKSAQALGIPVAVPVASWDHLSSKGLTRVEPDMIVVWNEVQRREAVEFHWADPKRVVVTGAQPFDRWFGRQPSRSREAFCQRVGLPSTRPFVLFVGSTPSISAHEAERSFVQRWIGALRASDDPAVRELAVLVRPHPYNPGEWESADLSDLGEVAVWPRGGANPVDEGDRADYFDSLYHAEAVVGINTSAMIEAAIVGRPVFTILAPEFSDTQVGTLHFRYLLPEHGGFLRVAAGLDEHVRQLSDAIANPERTREQILGFVRSFVRPHGLDRDCTPLVADAIERLGASGPLAPRTVPAWLRTLQFVLWLANGPLSNDAERRRAAWEPVVWQKRWQRITRPIVKPWRPKAWRKRMGPTVKVVRRSWRKHSKQTQQRWKKGTKLVRQRAPRALRRRIHAIWPAEARNGSDKAAPKAVNGARAVEPRATEEIETWPAKQ